ncbi:MAG: zinc ABC transporter substrate-binding protein [Eubacterium sp.]|nr:zinc ABC transporter substrate-binding protein [Eubacterium sp.]
MKKEFKTIRKIFASMVAILLVGSLTACSVPEGSAGMVNGKPDPDKLQIVTTIFPGYDWVREIVGSGTNSVDKSAADKADITMLLDNGVDLHSYQPTAADIAKISNCDVFIYVGGESDSWVDDALKEAINKDMIVIDLLEVLGDTVKEEEVVEGMEAEEEEEEESEEEEGPEYDEHVWLSLKSSEKLCSAISDALVKADPDNADAYKANVEAYQAKLDELDAEYQKAVDEAKYDTILFGDRFPFRYMVDDYGLNYYAAFVGCSAETEASFETIIFLSEKVDELELPAIFTIEGSDGKIANTIKNNTKAKNQEILTINSLQSIVSGDVENGTTYLNVMKDNLEVLKKAIN